MRSRAYLWLQLYQVGAGLSDTLTGAMLLVAPLWTLRLMHLTILPTPAFASFIGAFVLGVGLTYLRVAFRSARGLASAPEWASQWRGTALIRGCVAAFLFWQIGAAHMEPAWLSVAVSDAALALVQGIGLHRGWLEEEPGSSLG